MELTQKLADLKKESDENDRSMTHWQEEHDRLQLEEVE
jgi:structural maintenance of chromosome 4